MHAKKLSESINLLTKSPILEAENAIVPLNCLEYTSQWGNMIGFWYSPYTFLPVHESEYCKAKIFDNCSCNTPNGDELPAFPIPACDVTYTELKNKPLPTHYIIYFDKIPSQCCQSIILQNYVVARLGYDDSSNRSDLISNAVKMNKLKKPILSLENSLLKLQHGTYMVWQYP